VPVDTQQVIDYLSNLGNELESRGFSSSLPSAAEGRPRILTVINPAAPALSENVMALPDTEGVLWFWFPWRMAITPAVDIVAAADRVERVLAEVGRPTP
jgi:hypothetical protein